MVVRALVISHRISGFCSREAKEHICIVGFSKGRLVLYKSKIEVTCLLEFVNLGHSSEPWQLQHVMESRSGKQASVTSNGGVHMGIFFVV